MCNSYGYYYHNCHDLINQSHPEISLSNTFMTPGILNDGTIGQDSIKKSKGSSSNVKVKVKVKGKSKGKA